MSDMPQQYDFSDARQKRTALLRRWGALKVQRSSWRDHWADIGQHLLPRSGRFFRTERNRGEKYKYNRIFDNTGTRALRTLGAGMMAGASSPARPWFKLQTADPDLNESHEVRLWLDDVVHRMQRVFAKSNTYRTMHKMYEELGAFGTSVSTVLFDFDNVIHHYPAACGEYCLQQDDQGRVVALYREFERTVGEVVKEYGLENCSNHVRQSWSTRSLESPVNILHVIEPRADQERNPDSMLATDMPWLSCHLEIGGDDDKILRESGFRRFPVLAPRWGVDGGDVYGTSPGMEALGDIRQLQQEQLRKGQAIDYQVRPPLQVPTSMKAQEHELFPGGLGYADPGTTLPFDQVTPQGGIRSAFDVRLDLGALLEDIQDCRLRINSSFHADLFLMIHMADKNQVTATEIAERHEEKLLMLGPVLDRVHNEMLHPSIDIAFEHMADAGLIPEAPEEIQGMNLTVEFISILAQAQKAIGSNATDRFMANVTAISEVKPEVLDKVNFDKWVDNYADMLGIDNELIVPEEDVDALRQARAAMQAQAAQAEQNQMQAAAMKDAAAVKTDERNVVSDSLDTEEPEALPI